MTEWFREAFDSEYLALYAHRTEKEAEQAVKLIENVAKLPAQCKVLDAPCGAGRHARAFAALGMSVTGLDLSLDLISAARAEELNQGALAAHSNKLRPLYLRGDLRRLPFQDNSFSLVTNLFTSLGYFETDQENTSMLCGLIRVCTPGGVVVVDFMNAPQVRKTLKPHSERTTLDGIIINDVRTIQGQNPRVVKETIARHPDGTSRTLHESVRLFEPQELIEILDKYGAPVFDIRGDYEGSPHTEDSPRLMLFGKKN